jgi:hypothetical protein
MLFTKERKQVTQSYALSQILNDIKPSTWCENYPINVCQDIPDYCVWDEKDPSMIQCKNI